MIVRLAGEGRAVLNNDEFDVLVRSMEEVVNAAYERVSELNGDLYHICTSLSHT